MLVSVVAHALFKNAHMCNWTSCLDTSIQLKLPSISMIVSWFTLKKTTSTVSIMLLIPIAIRLWHINTTAFRHWTMFSVLLWIPIVCDDIQKKNLFFFSVQFKFLFPIHWISTIQFRKFLFIFNAIVYFSKVRVQMIQFKLWNLLNVFTCMWSLNLLYH